MSLLTACHQGRAAVSPLVGHCSASQPDDLVATSAHRLVADPTWKVVDCCPMGGSVQASLIPMRQLFNRPRATEIWSLRFSAALGTGPSRQNLGLTRSRGLTPACFQLRRRIICSVPLTGPSGVRVGFLSGGSQRSGEPIGRLVCPAAAAASMKEDEH